MKSKFYKLTVLIAALLGSAVLARASITVTEVSAIGAGPSIWTYNASFLNSTLNNGDFFTLNDFGLGAPIAVPAGWAFSESLTGPNSLPATDNPSVLNATFTWVGGNSAVISANPSTLVNQLFGLSSPGSISAMTAADYTTIDHVTSGLVAGTQSRVIGSIAVPSSVVTVPDAGTTVALLGCALLSLGGLRRKLSA